MKRAALFYWLIGIVVAALLITAAFYLDDAVRDFMTDHQTPGMRNFMRNVSRFGDWLEHFALGLVLAGVAWRRGNKKWVRIFVAMLIALSGLATGLVELAAAIATCVTGLVPDRASTASIIKGSLGLTLFPGSPTSIGQRPASSRLAASV